MYTQFGFPERRVLKIATIVSRQRPQDMYRIGAELTNQEVLKSGKSPYVDGVLVALDVLKDFFEAAFIHFFPDAVKKNRSFPCPVILCVSRV